MLLSGFFFSIKQDMKSFPVIIALFLISCGSINGQVPDSLKFKSLLPYDFHLTYLKEEKTILIDVREFSEFRTSRLKDAVNIPFLGDLELAADSINKECALFLYCSSGCRSKRVAMFFHDKGFNKLYSLEGGIVAWRKDGFPMVRKKVKRK